MELNQILEGMLSQKASDLYITVDAPILFRVDGELRPQGDKLNAAQVSQLLDAMMDQVTEQPEPHSISRLEVAVHHRHETG